MFSIIVLSCRLKWCTTNSSIQSTMIHSVHLYTDTMWIFFASKLINVKQLLSSTYQILFINVLYFTHNFYFFFVCRLDALRAGILQQRSIFLKLVYSIGEELMLTWTVVFIFYGFLVFLSLALFIEYTVEICTYIWCISLFSTIPTIFFIV
jgi:hypothetical protein